MAKKEVKRPVGRPKTKGRDTPRSIRVPDDEWIAWQNAAEREELTLSMWLRNIANRCAARSSAKPLAKRPQRDEG